MIALNNILFFLVDVLFGFFIFLLIMRVLLQLLRANFHNPICQFIAKMTDPVVLPMRKILPRVAVIDVASLLILIIVEVVKYILLGLVAKGVLFPWLLIVLLLVADIALHVINTFFYAILIIAIMSWISPNLRNSLTEILTILTEPLLRWVRRYVPLVSGFDLSALVALICLKIVAIIIISYMPVL